MLAPWKKNYDQSRQHIRKKRYYFTYKGPSSQSYGFSSSHVWMWELDHKETWAPKTWCFWTVVLEKTLESPLDFKEINQSILKEISSEYSLEGLMLKLKLLATWFEELTHWKRPWCWERLKPGREGDNRGWDGWMPSPTGWTWVWASSWSWWTGKPGVLQSMGSQRARHDWATELNWILLLKITSIIVLTHKLLILFCLFMHIYFSSVQSLSRVRLFATLWTAAHQASLSTNS